jgi:hypothetical protein
MIEVVFFERETSSTSAHTGVAQGASMFVKRQVRIRKISGYVGTVYYQAYTGGPIVNMPNGGVTLDHLLFTGAWPAPTPSGVPITFSEYTIPGSGAGNTIRVGKVIGNGAITTGVDVNLVSGPPEGTMKLNPQSSTGYPFTVRYDNLNFDYDPVTNTLHADDDFDAIPNDTDPDDDNDGLPDAEDPDHPDYNPADNDGDGITDPEDPDDDNDGKPDTTDPEPTNPDGAETDTDKDGSPDSVDVDDDGDGIKDADDSRPTIPDKIDPPKSPGLDTDNDGTPDTTDTDDDADGVPDKFDGAPTTSGTGGGTGGGGSTGPITGPGAGGGSGGSTGTSSPGGIDGDGTTTTGGTWRAGGATDDGTAKVLAEGQGGISESRALIVSKLGGYSPLATGGLPKTMTYSTVLNFGKFGTRQINLDFSKAPFPQARVAMALVMTWIVGNAFFKRATV